MSPPKNQRTPNNSPSKASKAKKLKTTSESPSSEVKGQSRANVNMATGGTAARRSLSSTMDTSQEIDSPPQWFTMFFADFEQRLEMRLEGAVTKRLDELTVELKAQFDKINTLEFEQANLKSELKTVREENKSLAQKIDDLENRSRRNNLVFYGIPEKVGLGQENCIDTLSSILRDFVGLNEDDMKTIDRCHRTPSHKTVGDNTKPRIIHVAFSSFMAKQKVRKECIDKFKTNDYNGRKIYVSDDFSRRILQLRKSKMETFKRLQRENKKPFFVYPDVIKYRLDGKVVNAE
ncbi:uncharacterized protein [Amphiura filiformis]|uniref:uncharacterized protein n=1 Tax=Amphiura filiformis TaxID=82378 RepID=UPI003B21E9A0